MRRIFTLSKLYVIAFRSFQLTFNWVYGTELSYFYVAINIYLFLCFLKIFYVLSHFYDLSL